MKSDQEKMPIINIYGPRDLENEDLEKKMEKSLVRKLILCGRKFCVDDD